MQFLNIMVINEHVQETDRENLFPVNEIVFTLRMDNPITKDILDLLIILQVFPSRSQARKNWRGPIPFPPGFSHFEGLGKFRKELCIWNPTE